MVKFLIERGARPDQRLKDGRTMLMKVAGRSPGNLSLLDFLLARHADPKAMDGEGLTPLTIAAIEGNVDAVRRLAPLDGRSLDKALMLSAASGHTHCLEALLIRGAYVNCRSQDEHTPLMYAAGKGHQAAVHVLLRHHANRFARDEAGRTAADMAEAAGFDSLAEILRDTSSLAAALPAADPNESPSLDSQTLALLEEPANAAPQPEIAALVEPRRPRLDGAHAPEETGAPAPGIPPGPSSNPLSAPMTNAEEPLTGPATQTTADHQAASPSEADVALGLRLGPFRERFESLLVTSVTGEKAQLKLLHQPEERAMITVMTGASIPHTPYEVTKITPRLRTAKGGHTVDVSEVEIRHRDEGHSKRLVYGSLARHENTHLVVEARRSGRQFAARPGDRFAVTETGERFTVTEVRPHQLILRNDATGTIQTIRRQ